MFRGSILCAALISGGNACYTHGNYNETWIPCCEDCNIDLTALEEFTADYDVVLATIEDQTAGDNYEYFNDRDMNPDFHPVVGTSSLPPNLPSDHGTVAVHARKLQLKLENHFEIPADFQIPPPHNPRQAAATSILQQLVGHDIHEELHINGVHGQASFHLASPVLNVCIQVDVPPPQLPPMDDALQQAQQLATMRIHGFGMHLTIDGDESVAMRSPQIFALGAADSRPELVTIAGGDYPNRPFPALKFKNYVNSVDNAAFGVRACEVEAHTATQTMLAGNSEVRDFVAGRIAEHQTRLQALLNQKTLNTRYNFIPLQIVDLMMAPVGEGCANEVLAQTAPMATSTFQLVVLGVCSCAMGVAATFGVMRKKAVPSADAYRLAA